MSHLTFDDLKQIITECAGQDEQLPLGEDALDTTFSDLGYDSLAVLETAAAVTQRCAVELADDEFTVLSTPREVLDRVNGAVARPA
ncbi:MULTISPECIES: acyl carrier protein [Streptomyces]|uniref:acyl carrier protein n=1 Tax=Streptomyces TaxID=1883 RepID=UPI00137151B6|nr:acyl carrier protein [Streptomyces sp. SID2888]MYV48424.1 actinorhodin polyketide synthase [Streptomyces sp. SID2888]